MSPCYWWNNPEWGVTVDGLIRCRSLLGMLRQRRKQVNTHEPSSRPAAHHSCFNEIWEPTPIFGYYPLFIPMNMLPDVTINRSSLQEEQLALYPLPLSPELEGGHLVERGTSLRPQVIDKRRWELRSQLWFLEQNIWPLLSESGLDEYSV